MPQTELHRLGILPASAFQATVATGADAITAKPSQASEGLLARPGRFFATLGVGMFLGYFIGSKDFLNFGGRK